jgi:outer membrane biosynthesis protein TonB
LRSAPRCTQLARLLALACAVPIAAAFVPVVGAAPAQEEPPATTVTTPAPEPAPDPAPDPAPPVKPKPRAEPRSAPVPRTRPVTPAPVPAPTYQAPSTYRAPSVRQETQVVRKPVRKAKKTSRSVAKNPTRSSAPTRPRPVTAPTITPVGGSLGASVSFGNPVQAGSGDAFDVGALLIVAGLSIGIACFTVALIPARRVPWRPAAIFVSERQLDLTLLGLAVLVASGFVFFWVKGL